ncbi:MAG: hypothetical protein SW127_09975 [Actinomycetota bacterium]|nr:hypothetical protein [Actinomycetota bacterium]
MTGDIATPLTWLQWCGAVRRDLRSVHRRVRRLDRRIGRAWLADTDAGIVADLELEKLQKAVAEVTELISLTTDDATPPRRQRATHRWQFVRDHISLPGDRDTWWDSVTLIADPPQPTRTFMTNADETDPPAAD